jgi:predicted CoA-binding protein
MPEIIVKIDSLVQDFLAKKRIAVVGVSDQRDTGCNLGYRKFKAEGYTVNAVNPRITTFEGDPCYPNDQIMIILSLPQPLVQACQCP